MTRLLSIVLLMVYTLTSSGATVYYHECGQQSQFSLSDKNITHKTCRFCNEKEKKQAKEHHCHDHDHQSCDISGECCKDVQIELKNSDTQLISSSFAKELSTLFYPVEVLLHWIILHNWIEAERTWNGQYTFDSGPPLSLSDTYLINCNFRI